MLFHCIALWKKWFFIWTTMSNGHLIFFFFRLIVLALTSSWFIYICFIIRKWAKWIITEIHPILGSISLCRDSVLQTAAMPELGEGGQILVSVHKQYFRHRRNLLTFSEVTSFYCIVIFYFLLESGTIFLMYRIQDDIGPDAVFYIIHTIYAISDGFFMVSIK